MTRILVVPGDKAIDAIYRHVLGSRSYSFTVAEPIDALDTLVNEKEKPYTGILTDYDSLNIDTNKVDHEGSLGLVKCIRSMDGYKELPIMLGCYHKVNFAFLEKHFHPLKPFIKPIRNWDEFIALVGATFGPA